MENEPACAHRTSGALRQALQIMGVLKLCFRAQQLLARIFDEASHIVRVKDMAMAKVVRRFVIDGFPVFYALRRSAPERADVRNRRLSAVLNAVPSRSRQSTRSVLDLS